MRVAGATERMLEPQAPQSVPRDAGAAEARAEPEKGWSEGEQVTRPCKSSRHKTIPGPLIAGAICMHAHDGTTGL